MKVMKSVLLAVALVSPALSFSAPVAQAAAVDSDVADYADAYAGAARQALSSLQGFQQGKSDSTINTAITQARIIQISALELKGLVEANASQDELAAKLTSVESNVYQLDALKRRLQSKYPQAAVKDVADKLTYVRTLYLNLKVLLTGEEV